MINFNNNTMFVFFTTVLLLGISSAQLIIPPRPLGYVYNNGSSDAPIHLDVHMGPLCPDSAAALPVIKQVADYYKGATLKLTLHMFPLPYHRQSYFTAIGAQAMRQMYSVDKAFCYFNEIYTHIEQLSNSATMQMNAMDVNAKLSAMATFCGADKDQFAKSLMDGSLENKVRTAWKYTCSRGISGTPTFLLNDVIVEAEPTWTLSEWRQVIDPLLQQLVREETCPIDTKKCEYLPGKIECCTKGENCIPNVGCRCFGDQDCNKPMEATEETCPIDTKKCEYLPGKIECCTKGENCIPNVGCRCFGDHDCNSLHLTEVKEETCPIDTKKCEYLPDKIECCTKGENCIPNVGCRCFGDKDCNTLYQTREEEPSSADTAVETMEIKPLV